MLPVRGLACRLLSYTSNVSLTERALHISSINMVKVGDKVPSVDLFEGSPANKVNIGQFIAGKKVVLFAVPGAFTPGCSKTHLPGYVKDSDALKSKGIDDIICVSVNDPFVMEAWGKEHHVKDKIRMLADPQATFTKAMEMNTDIPPLGGVRSKRYSMLLEDGVIKALNVEPDGTGLSCSLSDKMVV